MADRVLLPNFFILGAAKSGTTSLFDILSEHPQVFASPKKETRFFSDDENYQRGWEWYGETYFSGAAGYPVRMEATPTYLTWSEKTSQRLHDEYPLRELKFAVIFRDPVQRAYSHYWHRVRMGHEQLSFKEALLAEQERLTAHFQELARSGNGKYGYYRAGCYATMLKPYLEKFDREQFFFMLLEDIKGDSFQDRMKDLHTFLNLEQVADLSPHQSNQALMPRSSWIRSIYRGLKKTPIQAIYHRIIKKKARSWVYSFLFPTFSAPPLDPEIASQLRSRFAGEILELEQLIGRDLSKWMR
jgi:hypothetical protein